MRTLRRRLLVALMILCAVTALQEWMMSPAVRAHAATLDQVIDQDEYLIRQQLDHRPPDHVNVTYYIKNSSGAGVVYEEALLPEVKDLAQRIFELGLDCNAGITSAEELMSVWNPQLISGFDISGTYWDIAINGDFTNQNSIPEIFHYDVGDTPLSGNTASSPDQSSPSPSPSSMPTTTGSGKRAPTSPSPSAPRAPMRSWRIPATCMTHMPI